jgi:ABC-type sugar transport system ATPase subunit
MAAAAPVRRRSPPAARPPLIDVRNIVKQFGSVIALSGVSMAVEAGEVHCLLGDNGAGKSTLIKTLSASTSPRAGRSRWRAGPCSSGGRATRSMRASPRSTRIWR